MFNNVGNKLKGVALTMFFIELLGAFIAGFVMMAEDEDLIPIGLGIIVGGFLVAWVGALLLYGFGELIDKTSEIAENTRNCGGGARQPQPAPVNAGRPAARPQAQTSDRTAALNNLLAQGLISQEEYQQAISRNQ